MAPRRLLQALAIRRALVASRLLPDEVAVADSRSARANPVSPCIFKFARVDTIGGKAGVPPVDVSRANRLRPQEPTSIAARPLSAFACAPAAYAARTRVFVRLRIPIIAGPALIDGEAPITARAFARALAGRARADAAGASVIIGRGVPVVAGEALADVLDGAASCGVVAAHGLALGLDDEMIARVRGSAADAVIGAGGGRGAFEAVVAGLANVDRLAAVAARADEVADAIHQ